MNELAKTASPLADMDVSFAHYVDRHRTDYESHIVNGVPDYAFSLDMELRQKLMQIPHFYSISQKVVSVEVTRQIQFYNQRGIAVGPNQFSDIYEIARECAKTLGIGIPNIFILNQPGEINAFTVAADDASPMLILYSSVVERMTREELKAVIAHECGHIHNNHGVLKNIVNVLLSSASGNQGLGKVISHASNALMTYWTRAAEVTADRAGLICVDDPDVMLSMHAKLLSGGMMDRTYSFDLESLRRQMELTLQNPSRLYEYQIDHPSDVRRIFCDQEFLDCEVYYRWRPERRRPDSIVHTKEDTDERCKRLTNIWNNKK